MRWLHTRACMRRVRQARVWYGEWLAESYERGEPRDQASPPGALLPADTRRAALFAVFDEMEGHEEEFLQDGRPRVDNVNNRLSTHSQQGDATRPEIDEAFAAWRKSRNSEAPDC